MPRRPSVVLPNVPLHLIQRGNNRQACFCADDNYRFYLGWLETYARDAGCAVHAYVLMTNCCFPLYTARPFPDTSAPGKTVFPGLFGIDLSTIARAGSRSGPQGYRCSR